MRSHATGRCLAALSLCALAACGGGGDSRPTAQPPQAAMQVTATKVVLQVSPGGAPATVPTLGFDVDKARINVGYGTAGTLTVHATAGTAPTGALYAAVREDRPVLTDGFEVAPVDANALAVTLHTPPTLGIGSYTGTLQVLLCADAACQTPLAQGALPYEFVVAATPLAAAATGATPAGVHAGQALADAAIAVSGDGLAWTATSPASWLLVDGNTGTTPTAHHGAGTVAVHFSTGGLATGHYAASVLVASADGQEVSVPFAIDITPAEIDLASGTVQITVVDGAPVTPQTLTLARDDGQPATWSVDHSAAWMNLALDTSHSPARLTLTPQPATGPLAPGVHYDDLVIHSPGIADRAIAATLTLLPPTLTGSAAAVTLGGDKGRDPAAPQALTLTTNTGTNAWPLALSGAPAWLDAQLGAASVSQAGTALTLTPSAAATTPGSRSAVVRLSATVNGTKADFPLTVNLNTDERRLLPSAWGVGLAASPTGNVLSRQLKMRVNFGADVGWSARSDSAWLAVTANGSTGGAPVLTVTADPASLADGSISVANVTVTSTQPGVTPAVVRVGLWKSSVGAAATKSVAVPELNHQFVADPVRPLFYATTYQSPDLEIWNAYTGTRVAVVPNVGQGALSWSDISPDGRTFYALDGGRVVRIVDLDTLTVVGSFPLQNPYAPSLHVARVDGHDIVFAEGMAYENGRILGMLDYQGESMTAAATSDGRQLFVLVNGTSLSGFTLDYSAIAAGTLFAPRTVGITRLGDAMLGGTSHVAVGDNVLAQSVAAGCVLVDPATLGLVSNLATAELGSTSVAVTSDNRVVCAGQKTGGAGVRVFSSTGQLIGANDVADPAIQSLAGVLAITADGRIAALSTSNQTVVFLTLPH